MDQLIGIACVFWLFSAAWAFLSFRPWFAPVAAEYARAERLCFLSHLAAAVVLTVCLVVSSRRLERAEPAAESAGSGLDTGLKPG